MLAFKSINFIVFLILFFSSIFSINLSAKEISYKIVGTKDLLKHLNILIKKDYRFYSKKNGAFYWLGGDWIEKVTEEDMYTIKNIPIEKEIDPELMLQMIVAVVKRNQDLYFTKKDHVYLLKNFKFIQIYPPTDPELEWLKKEKNHLIKEARLMNKIYQDSCSFCQFQLSGNFITYDNRNPQVSPELSWLPYYQMGSKFAIGFPVGLSSFIMENNNLNETIVLGLQMQILPRYIIGQYFLEMGPGILYFLNLGENSSLFTFGGGRYLSSKFSLLFDLLSLNYVYFHLSNINYKRDIREFKFGIGASF